MNEPTPKEKRFRSSLRSAQAHRRELLNQLIDKIEREEKKPLKEIPVNFGILGDLEYDILQLQQLLSIEPK